MAVEVYGNGGEINGYGDAMDSFRAAEEQNSRILLNLIDMAEDRAAGRPVRKKNAPRPDYDPRHEDNQWPVMVYHATNGYKVIGENLKGLTGIVRKDVIDSNRADYEIALDQGYRREPYAKVQIALLDPAAEKAALIARDRDREGQLVLMNDLVQKLTARLESMETASNATTRKGGK